MPASQPDQRAPMPAPGRSVRAALPLGELGADALDVPGVDQARRAARRRASTGSEASKSAHPPTRRLQRGDHRRRRWCGAACRPAPGRGPRCRPARPGRRPGPGWAVPGGRPAAGPPAARQSAGSPGQRAVSVAYSSCPRPRASQAGVGHVRVRPHRSRAAPPRRTAPGRGPGRRRRAAPSAGRGRRAAARAPARRPAHGPPRGSPARTRRRPAARRRAAPRRVLPAIHSMTRQVPSSSVRTSRTRWIRGSSTAAEARAAATTSSSYGWPGPATRTPTGRRSSPSVPHQYDQPGAVEDAVLEAVPAGLGAHGPAAYGGRRAGRGAAAVSRWAGPGGSRRSSRRGTRA